MLSAVGEALSGSILSISSSHSSCTTRRISANVGSGKSGWYILRIPATRSVTRISVSVMPTMSWSRSIALNLAMCCSMTRICSSISSSWAASGVMTSEASVSGQPINTASAYSSEARSSADAIPSSTCTRNTYRTMLNRSDANRNLSIGSVKSAFHGFLLSCMVCCILSCMTSSLILSPVLFRSQSIWSWSSRAAPSDRAHASSVWRCQVPRRIRTRRHR